MVESAQVGLTRLDKKVGVVAFIDADCHPAPNWLREMVAPFSDPRVAAATGFRWAAPRDTGWGTLARYVFLATLLPQHILYRIPWGGSLVHPSGIEGLIFGSWAALARREVFQRRSSGKAWPWWR